MNRVAQGPTTIRQLLHDARGRLAAAGVASPDVDAALLVRHVLNLSRTQLILRRGDPVAAAVAAELDALVRRREQREPLQLLLGSVGFRHLTLDVAPGVFIPRPETEVLAGEAVARVPAGGVVVEPCTGTGAVACAVSLESAADVVVATDISPAAVELARRNASRTGARITVEQGDLLGPVPVELRGCVDVLVANPPYLATADLQGRDPEVVEWDPPAALVAGPSGHEVTDRLLGLAPLWLRPRGWVLLEVDTARASAVAQRAAAAGLSEVAVVADLTGSDRIVVGRAAG